MPFRLINPKATKTIEISGVNVTFRQLTGGEKGMLGIVVSRETDRRQIEDIAGIIGNAITAVDGYQPPFEKLLVQLEDAADFWRIVSAVQQFATLEDDNRKNSSCLSDGSEPLPDQTTSEPPAAQIAGQSIGDIAASN